MYRADISRSKRKVRFSMMSLLLIDPILPCPALLVNIFFCPASFQPLICLGGQNNYPSFDCPFSMIPVKVSAIKTRVRKRGTEKMRVTIFLHIHHWNAYHSLAIPFPHVCGQLDSICLLLYIRRDLVKIDNKKN